MQFSERVRARVFGLLALTTAFLAGLGGQAVQAHQPGFTTTFHELERCDFKSVGSNTYFVLIPGYRQVLVDRAEDVRLTVTVLNETKRIRLGERSIEARIVEERETQDGVLFEVARNFFAICDESNSAFYFGEEVDFYGPDGRTIIGHEGSWEAGKQGAMPGLQMPSTPLLGARYHQEVAPGVAQDRAEIISIGETVRTRAGTFRQVLRTEETTPLEPGSAYKLYAPGIGLIQDGGLELQRCSGISRDPCTRSRGSD